MGPKISIQQRKRHFRKKLNEFVNKLCTQITGEDNQWTIKGFIDVYKNVYTISVDTKIISKILEIHLFPKILDFANQNGFNIVLPEHQNYYPDLSFIDRNNEDIKFAVDLKTTYRNPENPEFCNGFTLGSHGRYFIDRTSTKNIQYPYSTYAGHFILGIIYSRAQQKDDGEFKIFSVNELKSITSVIRDFQFFVAEKWEIASDRLGSHNTANIGSIQKISDIIAGNGVFKTLGERWFDDYWINYGKINIITDKGKRKSISRIEEFLEYRGKDQKLANPFVKPTKRRDNEK